MKDFFCIFNILLKNSIRNCLNKRFLYIVISCLLCYGISITGVVLLAQIIKLPSDDNFFYKTLIDIVLVSTLLLIFIMAIIALLTFVYNKKDVDIFFYLPIKPTRIYFAKLIFLYFGEILTSAIFIIPVFLYLGITSNKGFVFYAFMIVAIFEVPFLALFLGTIVSIAMQYLIKLLRGRLILISIISFISFFFFIFAIYWFAYRYLPKTKLTGFLKFEDYFKYFIPLNAVSNAAFANNILLNLAIIMGSIVVSCVIIMMLCNWLYLKTSQYLQESDVRNTVNKKKEYKTDKSIIFVLMKKEMRCIGRDHKMLINVMSTQIMIPILIGIRLFIGQMDRSNFSIDAFNFVLYIVFLGLSLNMYASTCISREGSKFYYMKIIPIKFKTQLKAKIILSLFFGFICVFLCMALIMIKYQQLICLGLTFPFVVFNMASVYFSVLMDVSKPFLNWNNQKELFKRNLNFIWSMIIMFIIGIVVFYAPYFLFDDLLEISSTTNLLYTCIISTVIFSILFMIFRRVLIKNTKKYFEKIA